MKAALFHSRGNIKIVDKDIPIVKDNEVLLKIDYSGICGTDKRIFSGEIECNPVVLGHEFSGKAVEVGPIVKSINIGQYYNVQPNLSCGICSICRKGRYSLCENKISYGTHIDGGFAEYCVVDSEMLFPINNITPIESVLIEPVACCVYALKRCNISVGQNVLIIGGGFTGLIFVQLAKLRGANVYLITRSEKKRTLARIVGADEVYESIHEIDKDFDVVIEAVGKTDTVNDAFQVVGRGGKILLFGVINRNEIVSFSPYEIWEKEIEIVASRGNGHNHFDAIQILPKLNVHDLISHVVELDDIESGFKSIGEKNCTKVIVRMSHKK